MLTIESCGMARHPVICVRIRSVHTVLLRPGSHELDCAVESHREAGLFPIA
jgi:hypothetical protein